jgi:hypothetical protein
MYTASFSEFSYGYAITDNILHSGLPYTGHAPVFPSLLAEGSAGGGYDVRIPLRPVAVFLQFKIPQVVRRRSDYMPTGFLPPYLRMHLRTKHPNQHQLLLDLEATQPLVFYATPNFWSVDRLDRYFAAQQVHQQSLYIRPSAIGPLDDRSHHVAYRRGHPTVWVRSEPFRLEAIPGSEQFAKEVDIAVRRAKRRESIAFLRELAVDISSVSRQEAPLFPHDIAIDIPEDRNLEERAAKGDPEARRALEGRSISIAAREVAYASQVRLGCTLLITGSD